MSYIYLLTLESDGLDVIAGVNGVPLLPNPEGRGCYVQMAINEWLLPEHNTLTIQIDWPRGVDYESGVAGLSASVTVAGIQTATLVSVNWPLPGIPESYPRSIRLPFLSPIGTGTQLFQKNLAADGITVENRAAALSPVLELHAALSARNQAQCFALLQFKFSEIVAAYPDDTSDILGPARIVIEDLLALSEVAPAPINPDELLLEPMAGGHIFHVKRRNGKEAIRYDFPDGLSLDIPVFAGFVGGEWVIAR